MRISAVILLPLVSACTSVGSGHHTLVPASVPASGAESAFTTYFPDLVSTSNAPPLRALTPFTTEDRADYSAHRIAKYGEISTSSLNMSLVVRQRTTTPPFLPTDIALDKELMALYLNKDLTDTQKNALSEKAKAKLYNVPDLPHRTTVKAGQPGQFLYFYYPRLKLELSSKIQSPSQLDRISYLGMVFDVSSVKSAAANEYFQQLIEDIPTTEKQEAIDARKLHCTALSNRFRIIDFQPKASDIFGFTRGELTQAAQLKATATYTNNQIEKITQSATTGADPDISTSGQESTSNKTLTPFLEASATDTFVNALKDSIEARTAGFLNEGKAFFADFRSIKERRIGGTYDFDLMLEVPAFLYEEVSIPCGDLDADAYLIGVVRHVYERGFSGTWQRVPEPENDKAFFEVVVHHIPNVEAWRFDRRIWGKAPTSDANKFTVSVVTNDSEAQFVVTQKVDAKILGQGSGKMADITISPDSKSDIEVRVEFLDINRIDEGSHHTYTVGNSPYFLVPKNASGKHTITGNYR